MKIRFIFLMFFLSIIMSLSFLYASVAKKEDKSNKLSVKSNDKIIVAKIDNLNITYQDYLDFLDLFNKKPSTNEEKLKMLNHLIERTLIIEDAKEKGYFGRKTMKENIKKHRFLEKKDNSYQTTIILRQYFIENISKKVNVTTLDIDNYVKKHKNIDRATARDYIALEKEKKLYKKLIEKLKKGKKIVIYKENLK